MERSLTIYLADPAAAAHPFDVRTIPVLSTEQELVDRRKKDVFVDEVASAPASATAGKGGVAGPLAGGAAGSDDQELEQRAQALGKVPELAHLPDPLIHDPPVRPSTYPKPIVGHVEARARALALHDRLKEPA